MAWMMLVMAGLGEVIGVIGIKRVAQKGSLINYVILIGGFVFSFSFLRMAMEQIALSTAYAVWTGIGTLGSTLVGILFYKEPKNLLRIVCILGIVFTVIGLKIVS